MAAALHPQTVWSPLVSPEPERVVLRWRRVMERNRLSEEQAGYSWLTSALGPKWALLGPWQDLPSMPASLLSCLCLLGAGAVFQNALTAEQSPPISVSGPCVSHPARRTGWPASRTEPAQSHRCTLPSLAPAPRCQPGAIAAGGVGGGGLGTGTQGWGFPERAAPSSRDDWRDPVTGDADPGAGSWVPAGPAFS